MTDDEIAVIDAELTEVIEEQLPAMVASLAARHPVPAAERSYQRALFEKMLRSRMKL